MALYAAYGSNMDPAQMLVRCPHSPQRGTGWLEGWRLTFGGEDIGWDGAMATVVEDPGTRVFVVLYDVSENNEKELDNWDGATLGYYRKAKVRVEASTATCWRGSTCSTSTRASCGRGPARWASWPTQRTAGAPADYVAALRERPCANQGDSTTEPDPPWS